MRRISVALVALLAPAGCAESAALGPTSAETVDDASARAGEARTLSDLDPAFDEVPCIDQQIAELGLTDELAPGLVTQVSRAGAVFEDAIDATAGGLSATAGYVYARFGASGLEKVYLDDESAFASRDWDIAFRRYVIRLNSGVSGPSSVIAAQTPESTSFDDVSAPPAGLTYRVEQYYTPSCTFVPDDSGIGAPATALAGFWTYDGCVAMTGNVFVLVLASGRHVKLQVMSYYSPENQERCQRSGTTQPPSGAGSIRVRWAFLD